MDRQTSLQHTPAFRFEKLNWIATEALPYDQEQSHRLHEPDHRVSTIDPITGRDIDNLLAHPSLADGNLTIYFESEETRAEFESTPVNHPYAHFIGDPSVDMDRGG